MNESKATMVRVYLNEGHGQVDELLHHLHDQHEVSGVTVFRAAAGYGDSGKLHTASLVDLSLDLPVVIEFFDAPFNAVRVIEDLRERVQHGHIVHWDIVQSM